MWVEANNNIVFTLWSNDGFGNGTVGVNIKGKNYRFEVDPVNFERWQRMSQWRPGKVLNDIKDHAEKRRKVKMSKPVTGPVEPKKMVQKTLSFREWMKNDTSYFLLSEDPSQKGYRRLGNIQFGPYAGQSGWWHPETKDIIPDSMVGQPDKPQIPQQQRPQQGISQQQPQQQEQPWILAKSQVDNEELKLRKDQLAMLKKHPTNNSWIFASYYKGKIHNFGEVPTSEVGRIFTREEADGSLQRAKKPSEGIDLYHPKEESKNFELTAQQQEIHDQFERIHNGEDSHMMIGARAGTGKTTMLKHLAQEFGGKRQNWIYLVFGTKNGEEARESFPEFMKSDIMTTHSYAGKVLDANNINPTERIYDYIPNLKKGNKLGMIMDGPQYRAVTKGANILHVDDMGGSQDEKYAKKWVKKIWREFNKEVEKIVGLLKSFNLNPSSNTYEEDLRKVIGEYEINSSLEQTKEQLEKDPNKDFHNDNLSQVMGIDDFLGHDFVEEMIQVASWIMQKSIPHGIDQEFHQTHEKSRNGGMPTRLDQPIPQNLRGMRDFDDDLWFAAMHADEIDWTKPKKYDFVLADEVQDFNIAQKKILEKLLESGAKIVAVGDPRQSLYRFRGASETSFQDIADMLKSNSENPNAVSKQLTKNFRSKPGLINRANQGTVVNDIEAGLEDDPFDPEIYTNREMDVSGMMDLLGNEMEHLGELQKQTAVLARTNEPLAKTAMELMKAGIPFEIMGWDLSNEVINLINRVLNWQKGVWEDINIADFQDIMNDFVDEKRNKWGNQVKKQGDLKDMIEGHKAISSAIDMIGDIENKDKHDITVKELKDWLRQRLGGMKEKFKSKKEKMEYKEKLRKLNPVILTTAHKSKGLEFDRVFEITPSLYPHPKAKLPADLDQEDNAWYVGHTRPRSDYHIIDDED